MLTRLEVQGFKNLLDVQADFGPFTCIAGANGVGKSNVFDAIEFLSHLSTESLMEAAQRVRGSSGAKVGDPRDLFWDGYRDHQLRMRLTAEMIVPAVVEDDLGAPARATTTFLRYSLVLGYESPPSGQGAVGRLTLLEEELRPIRRGDAGKHLKFPHSADSFRASVIQGDRRGRAFLSTEHRDAGNVINVHGDGGSSDKPQPRAAARTGRTVLSAITTNDYPTIVAARREMQSWRRLALEPSALRSPDGFADPRAISASGRYVASTLYRIASGSVAADGSSDPDVAVFARVAERLSDLAGVGVQDIDVELDQVREVFTLFLVDRNGLRLPARALSEGTLRFLALCVLLEDPTLTGLVCMEEPENGIHPANLPAILSLISDLAVDADLAPDETNPFRQVIVNTHSPGVVQLCPPSDLLLADGKLTRLLNGRLARSLSLLPFKGSWRAADAERSFTEADMVAYLAAPANVSFRLPQNVVG
jgi:predicted ATPase